MKDGYPDDVETLDPASDLLNVGHEELSACSSRNSSNALCHLPQH